MLRAFAVSSGLFLLMACAGSARDEESVSESALSDGTVEVIFSPQAGDKTHTARIAKMIDAASHSIDIAMYSFGDAGISRALEDAVGRGVKVRMLFEPAGDETRLTGSAKDASKSGKLEAMGVDVRYVNKIMHHKFVIVDGPRDDVARAETAQVASGSANWSGSAATKYDENTLFFQKRPELALKMQREFDLMWTHSRDFALATPIDQELSTLDIPDAIIDDDASVDVLFTSANFRVNGTTFSSLGTNVAADALVAAIRGATRSVHVASGHLRSRPVALALMEKARTSPNLDIRVYLDGQEYISQSGHRAQEAKLETCLENAGASESKKRLCTDKGFLYGYAVGKAGAKVRYKYYAYRWDASYAKQMHNKFMVVDGDTLFSGSYNLSDNAEHETFENILVFRGAEHAALVSSFEQKFESLWETGRTEKSNVEQTIRTASDVPLVFDSLALTHAEVASLKRLIAKNCPAADSPTFRQNAAAHQTCPRGTRSPNGVAPMAPAGAGTVDAEDDE